MTDNEEKIITMYTRVAWFDRDTEKYSFCNWHCLTSKNPKDYQNLQTWIQKQNKPHCLKQLSLLIQIWLMNMDIFIIMTSV